MCSCLAMHRINSWPQIRHLECTRVLKAPNSPITNKPYKEISLGRNLELKADDECDILTDWEHRSAPSSSRPRLYSPDSDQEGFGSGSAAGYSPDSDQEGFGIGSAAGSSSLNDSESTHGSQASFSDCEEPLLGEHSKCRVCVYNFRNRCNYGSGCNYCHHPVHATRWQERKKKSSAKRKGKRERMQERADGGHHEPEQEPSCGILVAIPFVPVQVQGALYLNSSA